MHTVNPTVKIFLAGDCMPARGIDQILPHPGDSRLYEAYVKDAGDYVQLAEQCNGPIPRAVDYAYVWGVALQALQQRHPDVRLINLETAITASGQPAPKGINYRLNPANLQLLKVANIDCCSLANNHVLDWGETGLIDTLRTLSAHDLHYAGAGLNRSKAEAPAILPLPGGRRLLVFALGTLDSGIAAGWAADKHHAGVALLEDLSPRTLRALALRIRDWKQADDRVVVSIHWGGNWGFTIAAQQVRFAHGLIDEAGVDLLHGHSSHHIKGIEVYKQRLILYGCGDLLDDYEGIGGYRAYRSDLGFLYFAELDSHGRLMALELLPIRQQRLHIQHAEGPDRQWLLHTLNRESARFNCRLAVSEMDHGRSFSLRWPTAGTPA